MLDPFVCVADTFPVPGPGRTRLLALTTVSVVVPPPAVTRMISLSIRIYSPFVMFVPEEAVIVVAVVVVIAAPNVVSVCGG